MTNFNYLNILDERILWSILILFNIFSNISLIATQVRKPILLVWFVLTAILIIAFTIELFIRFTILICILKGN